MQSFLNWVKGFLVLWFFCYTTALFALPAVESRTGEPVVRAAPMENAGHAYHEQSYGSGAMPVTLDERAARLTLKEIETLQKEVSELRGLVEVQDHEIKQLKKSQQDFYIDLDRRLTQVSGGVNTKSGKAGALEKSGATSKETSKDASKELSKGTSKQTQNSKESQNPKENSKDTLNSKEAAKEPSKETSKLKTSSLKETASHAKDATATLNPGATTTSPTATTAAATALETANELIASSTTINTTSANSTNIATGANMALASAPDTMSPTAKKSEDNAEGMLYQGAYNLVKTKRYEEALRSFQEYVDQFPKGAHVANAHYWMGEVYMVQWQNDKTNATLLDKAQTAFSSVSNSFPNHIKSADATLKLGLIELNKGNEEVAKQHLNQVKIRYKGTAAARVAETRLQQLN